MAVHSTTNPVVMLKDRAQALRENITGFKSPNRLLSRCAEGVSTDKAQQKVRIDS